MCKHLCHKTSDHVTESSCSIKTKTKGLWIVWSHEIQRATMASERDLLWEDVDLVDKPDLTLM